MRSRRAQACRGRAPGPAAAGGGAAGQVCSARSPRSSRAQAKPSALLGRNHSPPEPGFARREANYGEATFEATRQEAAPETFEVQPTLARRGLVGEPGVPPRY